MFSCIAPVWGRPVAGSDRSADLAIRPRDSSRCTDEGAPHFGTALDGADPCRTGYPAGSVHGVSHIQVGSGLSPARRLAPADHAALHPRFSAERKATPGGTSAASRLKREIAEVRDRGLAQHGRESNEDVRCVETDVRVHTGKKVAAMSILVPTPRWNDASRGQLTDLVLAGAHTIPESLGHRDALAATTSRPIHRRPRPHRSRSSLRPRDATPSPPARDLPIFDYRSPLSI